jgi:hypothetical protein
VDCPRILLFGVAGTSVALAVGCGGSESPSTSAGSLSSTPTPAATAVANTKSARPSPVRSLGAHAQYVAFARAVNLRPSDLPGFTASPKKREHWLHNKAFEGEGQYQRCLQFKESKPLFKASSDNLQSGTGLSFAQASSGVEVMPSAARVRHDLRTITLAFRSPSIRGCLTRTFDALGTQTRPGQLHALNVRVLVGRLRVTPIRTEAAAGTAGTFGVTLRLGVTYVFSAHGRTVPVPVTFYVDVVGAGVGRAEITLTASSLNKPFDAQPEASLFALLTSRAASSSHTYPAIAG